MSPGWQHGHLNNFTNNDQTPSFQDGVFGLHDCSGQQNSREWHEFDERCRFLRFGDELVR